MPDQSPKEQLSLEQQVIALRQERNLLRSLIDNLPDFVYIKDPGSRFILLNEAVRRHLGAATIQEVIGKTDFDFSPHELAGQYYADEQAILASNESRIGYEELIYDHETDRFRWMLTTKIPLHDEQGQVIGLVGLNRDITELKEAQEALRKSEARYRAIVEDQTELICRFRLDKTLTFVNDAYCRYFDQTVETLLGQPFTDFILEEERARWEVSLASLSRDNPVDTIEYRVSLPYGETRWHRWTNRLIFDEYGEPVEFQAVGRDITGRKQVEEALRESEARLEGVLNTATDAIITVDAHQKIVFFNMAAGWIFHYKPEEVIGRPLNLLIPERFHKTHHQFFNRFSRSGVTARPLSSDILRGRRADGQEFPIEAMVSQVEVSGQKFYTAILRDITDRRRAERERVRLFEAINRQREQLRALAGRLTEIQESERKQLARELHDQVGQNLTALGLNLNIIRSQIPDTLATSPLLYDRIDDSIMLTEQTMERIRDVMVNLRPPVLDDYGLIAALRWYSKRFSAWSGLSVYVEGEEPTPRLETSVESTLFRVVQEALTNVAKHAQAGHVTINLDISDAIVCVTITDDGIGFEVDSLGEPAAQGGWGLLSMIERIEAIGGHFQIDSSPGKGTEIIIEVAR